MTTQEYPLFVTSDIMKSDSMPLAEMLNSNREFKLSSQEIIKKDVEWYEFKFLIHYYPSLAKNKSSKEQTWSGWSAFQNIKGEPGGRYIKRSRTKDNTYKCCDVGSKNARHLLNIDWANKTFFDMPPQKGKYDSGILKSIYRGNDGSSTTLKDVKARRKKKGKEEDIEVIEVTVEYAEDDILTSTPTSTTVSLPEELELEDIELFKCEGEVVNIETRGARDYNSIYFNAYDIGEIFKISNLSETLFSKTSSFIEGESYKIFKCGRSTDLKNTFLTYEGLFELAGKARNNSIARDFRQWGLRIIYSAHIGNQDDRLWAASESLGISCMKISNFISNTFTGDVTGIYLISVGKMRDHRENVHNEEEFKDGADIYKIGLSHNISRRLKEHQRPSGFGKNIILLKFAIIDVDHVADAETYMKGRIVALGGKKVEYRKSKTDGACQSEVFSLDADNMKTLQDLFTFTRNKYTSTGVNTVELEKIKSMEENIMCIEREREQENLEMRRIEAIRCTEREMENMIQEQKIKDITREAALEKENITREAAQEIKDMKATQEMKEVQTTQEKAAAKAEQEIKDAKAEQAVEKLKADHERELFKKEKDQFALDIKTRNELHESQKQQLMSALEIEKLKTTILEMKASK